MSVRLFAEFGVIVVGVLFALGVDAAWESREDGIRLEAYLRQLESDLQATDGPLGEAISLDSTVVANAVELERGLNARPQAPGDSLDAWLLATMDSPMFSPRSGTLQALVRSGDIRLLDDSNLHAAVMDYLNAVERTDRLYAAQVTTQMEAFGRLGQWINVATEVGTATPPCWFALSNLPGVTSEVRLMAITARFRLLLLRQLQESRQNLSEALRDRLG
jgi:hypothetical protein